MSVRVRVFLPTYRRGNLLPRAVASLRSQTVTDWICELHNDDPDDPGPAELVRRFGDPRIELVQHPRNFGPIETFNLFYRPIAESFSTLLEDDNAWEPTFLEEMLDALNAHPGATLAWCNQRIFRESADGTLHDTGTFANPPEKNATPRLQSWGDLRQITGALHANGAMLLRSRPDASYQTPAIPFGCVEAFRERMFPHPLVYVPKPLAAFTETLQTARKDDLSEWAAALAILAATYTKHARLDELGAEHLCSHYRNQQPPMTNTLIMAALVCREARSILRHIHGADWLLFLRNSLLHPYTTWRALRVRTRHADWWELLDRCTAARFRERETNR